MCYNDRESLEALYDSKHWVCIQVIFIGFYSAML